MKKINFFLITILVAAVALFSSCKKDAKIEKSLWSKGGEWTIESLNATQTSTNPSDNYSETVYNYGTLTFKKEGTGTFIITVDGDVEAGIFTYTNTEDKLTMIMGNDARIMNIQDWKKDAITLSITETYESNDEIVTYKEVMNLKKK